ncbi:MAG: hypothetical protein ACRDL7_00600 [Gaiellaceae bacterium]
MSSPEEEQLPEWIEDDEAVDEMLRDVVVPHESADDPEDGDDNGHGDGDGSRGQGRAA